MPCTASMFPQSPNVHANENIVEYTVVVKLTNLNLIYTII